MITEQLQALGDWDIRLRTSTPQSILDDIDLDTTGFGHVFITPVALADTPTTALLLATAIYTGVVFRRDRFNIGGTGPGALLSDAGGVGAHIEAGLTWSARTLAQVVGDLRPPSLNAGTVTAPGSPASITQTNPGPVDRMALLNQICDFFGVEWRINPNLTLDVGPQATLFTTTTPTAVAVPGGGRDVAVVGLPVTRLSHPRDVEDYSERVLAYDQNGAGLWASDLAVATPYNDINGNDVDRQRIITVTDGTPTSGQLISAQQVARFGQVRRSNTVSVDVYSLRPDVKVGDTIGLWDGIDVPPDFTNPMAYRGETIWPLKARVYGATWPVRAGMGVYLRRSTDGAIVDLTEWFEPETGDITLDLGAARRQSTDGTRRTAADLDFASPGGILALGLDPNARNGFTTLADIHANLQKTVQVGANRRLKVGTRLELVGSNAGMGVLITVREGSTEVARLYRSDNYPTIAGQSATVHGEAYIDSPSAGSHTYKLSIQRIGGAGTLDVRGDIIVSQFWIEDAGGTT